MAKADIRAMSQDVVKPSREAIVPSRGGGVHLWLLAIGVGLVGGSAIIAFRNLVVYAELNFFGRAGPTLATQLPELDWTARLFAPIVGGAAVALILRVGIFLGWGPAPKPFGHGELYVARRLRASVRASTLSLRDSLTSAAASIVSLGCGASVGREGPLMHLAASLGLLQGRLLGLDLPSRRILLGMGAAAGLSAALHTPIGAVLVVRELLLSRLRFQSLGPVALSSAAAWLLAETAFNGRPVIPVPAIESAPWAAFVCLALAAPVLAGASWLATRAWSAAPDLAARLAVRLRMPLWTLPAAGGTVLGVIFLAFPQTMGLGHETAGIALAGAYGVLLMLVLALVKTLTTFTAIGCRFGGGPIAPAMYVGLMMGGVVAAGVSATGLMDAETAVVFYGMVGLAVAFAVVLEAPVAAGVLALELSGNVEIGAAALCSALFAAFLARQLKLALDPPLPQPIATP